jgi:hypothetical protein
MLTSCFIVLNLLTISFCIISSRGYIFLANSIVALLIFAIILFKDNILSFKNNILPKKTIKYIVIAGLIFNIIAASYYLFNAIQPFINHNNLRSSSRVFRYSFISIILNITYFCRLFKLLHWEED